MKNFYISNLHLLRAKSTTVALKSLGGKIQKKTILLVLSMLLLSFSSFGQKTYYSRVTTGNWNDGASWSFTNLNNDGQNAAAGEVPTAIDIVVIKGGHKIIVTAANATCNKLTLIAGSGNSKAGGTVSIGSNLTTNTTPQAVLTLATLEIEIANGKPKENGTWLIGAGNKMVVNNAIARARKGGSTTSQSGEMYYELHPGSSIEYASTAETQNIFVLPDLATFLEAGLYNPLLHSGSYKNLILAGTGKKRARIGLKIDEDLTIKQGAIFSARGLTAGNYLHTIVGNVINYGTLNVDTATVINQLLVSGNLSNFGSGTFNAHNVTHTVSGNWTNSGTFNSNTSTVTLNGASKTITSTGTGAFHNLTVSNGTSSMATDINVNKELRVEATVLQTGTSTLLLGSTANLLSPETAIAHIRGNLQTTRNLATTTGELFGNIGIRITDLPGNINDVTVRRVTGTAFMSPTSSNSSVLRQFQITTPGATTSSLFNATIDMRFPDYELNAPTGTSFDIYRQNMDNSIEYLPKTETADPTYNYKLAKGDRKYGMYTLANRNTPLPVELTWFNVQRQAQGVLLTWETASEKENKGFEVQVSFDGKNFSKIAFVESKVVNSSVTQRYSYTDKSAIAVGTRYYRLAQVDLDGATTYSNLKAVDMVAKMEAAAAYPNPFAEGQKVTVRLPQGGETRKVTVVLTNTMGQVVDEQQAEVQDGATELYVCTAKANAKAVYLLNVIDNGTKYTFKLIKE